MDGAATFGGSFGSTRSFGGSGHFAPLSSARVKKALTPLKSGNPNALGHGAHVAGDAQCAPRDAFSATASFAPSATSPLLERKRKKKVPRSVLAAQNAALYEALAMTCARLSKADREGLLGEVACSGGGGEGSARGLRYDDDDDMDHLESSRNSLLEFVDVERVMLRVQELMGKANPSAPVKATTNDCADAGGRITRHSRFEWSDDDAAADDAEVPRRVPQSPTEARNGDGVPLPWRRRRRSHGFSPSSKALLGLYQRRTSPAMLERPGAPIVELNDSLSKKHRHCGARRSSGAMKKARRVCAKGAAPLLASVVSEPIARRVSFMTASDNDDENDVDRDSAATMPSLSKRRGSRRFRLGDVAETSCANDGVILPIGGTPFHAPGTQGDVLPSPAATRQEESCDGGCIVGQPLGPISRQLALTDGSEEHNEVTESSFSPGSGGSSGGGSGGGGDAHLTSSVEKVPDGIPPAPGCGLRPAASFTRRIAMA